MLRLATFGGVSLTRDGAPVVGSAAVPRRLALFALLAAHGERGLNKDLLAGLLWPDSAPDQARHSLHQALYATRRALGDDVIVGTTSLHLHPAHVESDVGSFEEAVHAGQFERAVKLYRGPFAEALVVPMAVELEQKLDALRAEFARKYTSSLESLAVNASRSGDLPASARWWRKLVDHDPLNGRYARELIASLAGAGETALAQPNAATRILFSKFWG